MRERPPLPDSALMASLAAGWGVAAAAVEFLPVGDDSNAWSYRVVAADGSRRHLKVRRGPVDPATVLVPIALRDHGLEQVVAAVPASDGNPWRPLGGDFTLLVYPWVTGAPALEQGLTNRQWVALGRFVADLHRTMLPAALAATVARESFVPWGAGPVRALDARVGQGRSSDPPARELATLWRAHRDTILHGADRAERLGRAMAATLPERVLCHADVHLANLLVDGDGHLAVVDGDGLTLAPRERDLCSFVTGGVTDAQRAWFFDGYGQATPDPAALAYYRWEWVVQELADYGGRIVDDRLGEATRRHALEEFRRLFAPGDVVEVARRVDRDVTVS
jgi:spectinomycin phosphotransferase